MVTQATRARGKNGDLFTPPNGGNGNGSYEAADIVTLDASRPLLAGRTDDAILDTYVFAGNANPVRDVPLHIGQVNAAGAISQLYRGTTETDANGIVRRVQGAIVHTRCDDILHGGA